MKLERHSKIVELIGKYNIETQEELAEYLNKEGYNVTQATVSRDIRELKLSKIQGEHGRQKYIKIGEYITFIPTNLKVKVASDDSIEYDGRIYKLSPFVGTFLPEEKRTPSNAYQGSKYFSYNGKILDDLRTAFEKEADNEINIVENKTV